MTGGARRSSSRAVASSGATGTVLPTRSAVSVRGQLHARPEQQQLARYDGPVPALSKFGESFANRDRILGLESIPSTPHP
jgi:hypothetical protein